tara:strand:+ start:10821 stop:12305 length:1485 start_codon:yes stop_codon:yes gene_type:complete
MKNIKNIVIFTFLALFVASCQDFNTELSVENLENPNDKILTSDPVALDALSTSIIQNWFRATHSTSSPAAALGTMADIYTCSWGNFGMRDLSSEPRVAFNNSSAYSYNNITNTYFNALYSILSDSNTLALAIKNGTKFENPDRVSMVAKLGQALSIGHLALVFDQVWVSDENGVIPGTGGTEGSSTYKEAMTFALTKLDEAIALAKSKNISLSEIYLPGGGGANSSLVAFMNSMGARMLVGNVRNSTQKAAIDWARVLAYTNAGLTSDFEIYMDDVTWYDLVPKTYMVYPGWARVDMRIINMLDPNTINYWTDGLSTVPAATSADARLASDYQYLGSNNFRPERGYYHYSNYRYSRLDDYITIWTMNVTEFSAAENDMYKAEALVNQASPNLSGAAAILNDPTNSRKARGKLVDVALNLDAIKAAIHYERMIEFAYTAPGIGFYEMRKENLLQAGTLLHFPVPGKALESIPAPNYTFGGTDGVAGEDYSTAGWR